MALPGSVHMMRAAPALVAIILTSCSTTATPSQSAEPDPTPSATFYTRAEQHEILFRESVHLAYGTTPPPDWALDLDRVSVGREGRAHVFATRQLSSLQTDLAERMCHDIAAVAFDDEAHPIGVTDLQVSVRGEVLAECHVPELP